MLPEVRPCSLGTLLYHARCASRQHIGPSTPEKPKAKKTLGEKRPPTLESASGAFLSALCASSSVTSVLFLFFSSQFEYFLHGSPLLFAPLVFENSPSKCYKSAFCCGPSLAHK